MISSIGSSTGMYSMTQMRQQMFSRIDTNGDDKHDKDELAAMVANGPTGAPGVDAILSRFDTDGDGAINESEFTTGKDHNQTQGAGGPPPPMGNMSSTDFLKQLFGDSDTNGDGILSADELSSMAANGPKSGLDSEEFLSKLDTDGDGVVSKAEFEASISNTTSTQQTAEDDFVKKLLETLQSNTSNSSSSTSSSSSSSSYQAVSEMLSAALKSYMQFSNNSFSQMNSGSSILGNSLFV